MLTESHIYHFKNSTTDDETDAWLDKYGQVVENSEVCRWAYVPSTMKFDTRMFLVWRDPRLMHASAWVFVDCETFQRLLTVMTGGMVTGKWYLVNKYDILPYSNAPIF